MRFYRRPLAASLARCSSAVAVCAALLSAAAPEALAANLFWDADGNNGNGVGGTGVWNTTDLRWLDTVYKMWPSLLGEASTSTALFQETPGKVSLGEPITANGLLFSVNGYTVDNGGTAANTLTLAGVAPALTVTRHADFAIISAVIAGTDGWTKQGRGSLYLTNAGSTYTGTTAINSGNVVVSSAGALGLETSAVVVNGNSTRGAGGGALVLEGEAAGFTFNRALSIAGGGVNSDGAALFATGNVNLTGAVTNSSTTAGSTRINSAFGMLTLGDLTVGGTAGSTFTTFAGLGSATISGNLAGTGTIEKAGPLAGVAGGTLILAPSSSTNFTGTVRVSGGSVRIGAPGALGANQATGTASALELRNAVGTLEVRADAMANNQVAFRNSIYDAAGGVIFLDHSASGVGINTTVVFDSLAYTSGQDITINGRNGYGITFNAVNSLGGNTGNATITLNQNGLATFVGDYTGVLNFAGNGDSVVTGNLMIGGTTQGVKSGTGTLTIQGNASVMGNFAVTGSGAVAVNYLGALGNTAGTTLQLATSTTTASSGTFNFLGAPGTGEGGTFLKTINLAGTVAGSNATILANQAGTAPTPLIIAGPFVSGAGSKTLTLGGSSTQLNEVSGNIPDNSATNKTSLVKAGESTWVLSGANTYTGTTSINAGVLKAQANAAASTVIADTSALNFASNATTFSAGGTFEFVGQANASNVESIGVLNTLSGAGTVIVTPGANGTATLNIASLNPIFTATTTAGSTASTTIAVPTAGLFAGQGIYGAGVTNATISSITSGTALAASASQTIGNGVPLTFTRPTGTSVNFAPAAGGSVVVGSVPATGLVGGYAYFGGADFAYAPTTSNATLRAPLYDGSDADFLTVPAGGALSDNTGKNYLMTGPATTASGNILSLKIAGSHTLTLGATQVLVINGSPTQSPGTSGGILVDGGSATITGGTGITTSGQGDLVIRVNQATDVLTLSTPITATTTGGLTKTGAGTLVVSALNSQTGATNILEGTVKLAGTAATTRISGTAQGLIIRQGGTFDLNGITMTNGVLTSLNGSGTITNSGSTPAIFFMGGSGGGGTFTGVLQDGPTSSLGFGKTSGSGTGTVNLNGLSTYTGPTSIGSTGSIATPILADIGQSSGIGKGVATDDSTNAASLVFVGSSGALSYTGTVSTSTNRLFTLSATTAGFAGQIANNSPNNSALILSSSGAIRFNSTVAQTLLLGGTSTGDSQFFPKLTNNGALATSLSKTSTGVWVLANQGNDYTGATSIGTAGTTGAGTLRIIGTALPSTSPVVFGAPTTATGGVLEMSGSFTRTLAASAVNGQNTVTWLAGTSLGGGFAASDSKLTVAIGGAASPTALTWGSGGFMTSTGNLILNSPTALSEVEFVNAINLGASVRPIDVGDNVNTFTDYATISGVLSGSGGISKSGAGTLHLTGLNTYTGTTAVTAGALVVSSLGDSAVAGSLSNLGAASSALGSGLILGNATTGGGTLIYVGHGETTDRAIQINATTASTLLYADGTGPLVLRNLQNSATGTVTGAKILALRGASTFANEISSNLSNDVGGGVLSILHDAPGTWILSGSNNFSGTVTNSLGALGLGSDTGFGTATLVLSNVGAYFAANGDRTLANAVTLAAGGSGLFVGDNSFTLSGALSDLSGTTSATITNNIAAGKSLNLNGTVTRTAVSNTSSLQLAGTGTTIINGAVMQTTLGTYGITVQGPGTVLVNTAQAYNGTTNVTGGTLKYGINQATPATAVTIGNAAGTNAVLDLNGFDATFSSTTALTFYGANASATSQATVRTGSGTLTLGGNVTVTATNSPLAARLDGKVDLTATRTFTVNDSANAPVDLIVSAVVSGSGFGITKAGPGTLQLAAANTYTGTTLINNGVLQYGVVDAIPSTNAVSVLVNAAGGTATLDLGNFSETMNALTVGAASGANTTSSSNVQFGTGTLTLGGTLTFLTSGSPLSSTITGANLNLGTSTRTITVADSTTAPIDLLIDANVIAASGVGLTKTGNGTLGFTKGLNFDASNLLLVTGGTVSLGGAANTFAGDLQVGYGAIGNLSYTTPGGTLSVGSGSANVVDFGVSTASSGGGTVNLAGSQKFTANVGQFHVGYMLPTATNGLAGPVVVTLATDNDITASTGFFIGDNGGGNGNGVGQAASVQFGSGTSTLATPLLVVGGRKGSPNTTAGAVLTIATGGTLTIDNGAVLTDLLVGNSAVGTSTNSVSTMDVSGGTLIAKLGNLVIANKAASGAANGSSVATLKIGTSSANNITANSVVVATNSGANAGTTNLADGTLSFAGGTFDVTNNVSVGLQSGGGSSIGRLLLTGGVFTIGGNLTSSNSAASTSIVTLDGGTLDMTAGIINVDTFNAQSGTLKNVAQFQAGDGATIAPLNKTTAGVLTLDGTNVYTGLTGIAEGTVVVSGSIAASSGVDIATGASFIMDGVSTNRVKDDAPINVAGGTLGFTNAAAAPNGLSETVGTLTLTANSVFDFGSHAANSLTLTGAASLDTFTLSIYHWSGSAYAGGATADSGDPLQDRLLFSSLAGTGVTPAQLSQISFFSDDGHDFLGYGVQIAGPTAGVLEIVPAAIPEPSSLLLLGSAALLGLRRPRRRR